MFVGDSGGHYIHTEFSTLAIFSSNILTNSFEIDYKLDVDTCYVPRIISKDNRLKKIIFESQTG